MSKFLNNLVLDDIYREIIIRLQENGRLSDSELSSQLNVSNDTIRRRRERLQESGIIRIRALVDPKKIGYVQNLHASIRLKSNVEARPFAEKISKDPNIYYIALSLGPSHQILTHYRAKTSEESYSFVENLRKMEEVESIDVNVIFDVIKSGYYRIDKL